MTENAGRREGLAGLVAIIEQRIKECRDTAERWKTESRNVRIDRAIHKDYSITLNALAGLLETALEAAAPAGTAPRTSDYPGCTVNELALELKRAVMVLCETRGHTGARPCKFCTDMHLWRLYQSIAEPLRTCNCGSPAGPHCESVHVAALATPSPQAPAATEIKRWFCQRCQREHSIAMPISGCEPEASVHET